VQFVVLASNAFPEDRDKWINLFKQSASFNPLANYFAAHEYFRQNQTEQAVAELAAASGQGIDDYTAASFQERQELFRSRRSVVANRIQGKRHRGGIANPATVSGNDESARTRNGRRAGGLHGGGRLCFLPKDLPRRESFLDDKWAAGDC